MWGRWGTRKRDPMGHVTMWDWAVRAYARPGVEPACLSLQGEYGHCVGYLLWATWAAQSGRSIDEAHLARAATLARHWETGILQPLRTARRALKQPIVGIELPGQENLHNQLRADELAAERLLLEALENLAPTKTAGAADLRQGLRDAARVWDAASPLAPLEALIQAFSDG
jgi:uncharacterized protein (TIGR02444 family)